MSCLVSALGEEANDVASSENNGDVDDGNDEGFLDGRLGPLEFGKQGPERRPGDEPGGEKDGQRVERLVAQEGCGGRRRAFRSGRGGGFSQSITRWISTRPKMEA